MIEAITKGILENIFIMLGIVSKYETLWTIGLIAVVGVVAYYLIRESLKQ
jgi:hypothetical protein